MDYKNSYLGNLFNAISQLGNALIGGSSDVSISARIGFNYLFNRNVFWSACNSFVNFTFFPLDGKGHCTNAYTNDVNEDFEKGKGLFIGLVIMVILMVLFCVQLSILFWSYYGIKKLIK